MHSLSISILFVLVAVVSSVATTQSCAAGEIYVSITKKCMDAAEEESYQIYKDNTLVVSSSPFADNEQRTDDFCLPSSANNQYVLKLRDSYGDSWVGGAWISVAGAYGNIVFKNYMTSDEEESFLLSLYYPLSKQQQWNAYFTKDTIDESWTALAFDDSTWEAMVPATTSTQQIGSQ